MRIRKATHEEPCDVVMGYFVFGPQWCAELTKFVTVDEDGKDHHICLQHIMQNRAAENRTAEANG